MRVSQVFSAYNRDIVQNEVRPHLCPECGRRHYHNPFPGVVTIIHDGEAILLGKRADRRFKGWCLPGGYIEFEEDFLHAAVREAKEETGYDISPESMLSVVSNFLAPDLHTLVIVVLATVTGGTPIPGDDIVELMWLSKGERFPPMAFEADRHIIERYWNPDIQSIPVDSSYG